MKPPRTLLKDPYLLGLGLVVAFVFASRAACFSQYLYSAESCRYVEALEKLDVGLHQPQPPGDPGYVFLGRLSFALIGDGHVAFLLLSLLASAVAAGQFWTWSFRSFPLGLAALLSACFVLSPVFWFAGSVALPEAVSLPLFLAFAIGGLHCLREQKVPWLPFVLYLLAGFLQPALWVLLLPGLFWFGWVLRHKDEWIPLLASLTVLTIGVFWVVFIPLSGGLPQWLLAFHQVRGEVIETSIFGGFLNLPRLWWRFLLLHIAGLNLLFPVGVFGLAAMWFPRLSAGRSDAFPTSAERGFLTLVLLTPWVYMLLFQVKNPNALLWSMPLLIWLAGEPLLTIWERLGGYQRLRLLKTTAATCLPVLMGASFLLGSGEASLTAIRRQDLRIASAVASILRLPRETPVIGRGNDSLNWRLLSHYLPEYGFYTLFPEVTPDGLIYRVAYAGNISSRQDPWLNRCHDQAVIFDFQPESAYVAEQFTHDQIEIELMPGLRYVTNLCPKVE